MTRTPSELRRITLGTLLGATVLTCGVGLATLGHHLAEEVRSGIPPEDDTLFLPRSSAVRKLSLGQTELAADIVYLRAVLYFGTQVTGAHQFSWLDNYLQTTIDLDPTWKMPYRWAGVATMYNGTQITRERVEASSHFLRLGIEHFPTDWEMPFMLGSNLLFEMKSKDAAEQARLTDEGVAWIRRAALAGGAPPWAALLAATILRKEGRQDAALHHLEQVYFTTSDERTRQEVKNRLISLKASIDFDREARERGRFETAWRESMPYAPVHLFVLVGSRPSKDLDWHDLTRDAWALSDSVEDDQ